MGCSIVALTLATTAVQTVYAWRGETTELTAYAGRLDTTETGTPSLPIAGTANITITGCVLDTDRGRDSLLYKWTVTGDQYGSTPHEVSGNLTLTTVGPSVAVMGGGNAAMDAARRLKPG